MFQSSIKHYVKRRSSIQTISSTSNLTDDLNRTNFTLSRNFFLYNAIKDGSSNLKRQLKDLIISFNL